jgi:hypothetical protein
LGSAVDPAAPGHVSDYATPHSLTNKTDAFYSAHNPEIRGTTLYLSWYSDGLRSSNLESGHSPGGRVVPATAHARSHGGIRRLRCPGRALLLRVGVHVDGDRIYLSDINFGLYVVGLR